MPRSRITIRDVAVKAGVSHQTVSRVINHSEQVTEETRQRVERVITEMGYSPNAIARYMARGSTRTLSCISPNLTDFTFASIIEGAEIEARQQGYFLMSASAPDEKVFQDLVSQLVESRRTEGLLVINPYADERHTLLPSRHPVVFVGATPRDGSVSSVALDDRSVALQAMQHLIDLGHRRIAMITGPDAEDCTRDRVGGYKEALQKAHLAYDESLVVTGDWSATSGYLAFETLFRLPERPTAVFAQNDRMAVGLARAAREAGVSIPEQLSLIGVDDMPLASYFDPPLTTMHQDITSIGREAVRLLIKSVESKQECCQQLLLPVELVVRQSTASAPFA